MLPEFLNNHGKYKVNIAPPDDAEALQVLKVWLGKKESESTRQTRPAWIEVVLAVVALVEQKLEQLQEEAGTPEMFSFETHIVARQVAKQRGERQIPTRFVTDEIKRISNHQLDYLESAEGDQNLALIGWYRIGNRRGLGIAVLDRIEALLLCRDDEAPHSQNQAEISKPTASESKSQVVNLPFQVKWFALPLLTFVLGAVLVILFGRSSDGVEPINILDSVLEAKTMRCGVDGSLPHFSLRNDAEQKWWGLDVELCKALGAALDVDVEFVKVSSSQFEERINALHEQKVHILFRNTSHTAARDLNADILFGPHYFYEREYFLDLSAPSGDDTVNLSDITGKNICVKPGTSNALTLRHLKLEADFNIITQNKQGEDLTNNIKLLRALRLDESLCDFVYGNYYVLKQLKLDKERRNPDKLVRLRTLNQISFDPLAPVLLNDYRWQAVVSYTIYALLYAEKLGINSYNVDQKYSSGNSVEQHLLSGMNIQNTGLTPGWIYRIIAEVGNYSEIYYRAIVCDYVACDTPSESDFHKKMEAVDAVRWPNKVFKADDPRPGLLYTPTF